KSVPVLADRDRIMQVVTNYLTNAVKFSPEDQPIKVQVRREARVARVLVRDYGVGLPAAEFRRVWDPYYRSTMTKAPDGSCNGLGLGLYISRGIVRCHQGRVGVTSTQGRGSTFWFTLPLCAAHPV